MPRASRTPLPSLLVALTLCFFTGVAHAQSGALIPLRTLAEGGAMSVSSALGAGTLVGSQEAMVAALMRANIDAKSTDALFAMAAQGRLHELPVFEERPELIPIVERWAQLDGVPVTQSLSTAGGGDATSRMCATGMSIDAVLSQGLDALPSAPSPQAQFLASRQRRIAGVLATASANGTQPLGALDVVLPRTDIVTSQELIAQLKSFDPLPLIAARIEPVAGFDLDRTVFAGDAPRAFLQFLMEKNAFAPEAERAIAETLGQFHSDSATEALGRSCSENLAACAELEEAGGVTNNDRFDVVGAAVAGMTPDQAEQLAYEFYTEGIPGKMDPWMKNVFALGKDGSASAQDLMLALQEGGVTIIPTTVGYDFMARAAARALGVSPDHIVASTMEVQGGKLTGRMTRNLDRLGKVEAFADDVGEAPLFFFGDSAKSDGPLMAFAGQGFMIHPTPEFLALNAETGAGFVGLTYRPKSEIEAGKATAGIAAVGELREGDVVGVGVGSTTLQSIQELGARLGDGRLANVTLVPSRPDVGKTATENGVPVTPFGTQNVTAVIDGSEEVDPNGILMKGLGPALASEKAMARQASANGRFYVIVTPDKVVEKIGSTKPLPIEVEASLVDDPARAGQLKAFREELRAMGGDPELRFPTPPKMEPGMSYDVYNWAYGHPKAVDDGNYMIDVTFKGGIDNPVALAQKLDAHPLVVEHGLFVGLANKVFIGEGNVLQTMDVPVPRSHYISARPRGAIWGEAGIFRRASAWDLVAGNDHVTPDVMDYSALGAAARSVKSGVAKGLYENLIGYATTDGKKTTFHVTGAQTSAFPMRVTYDARHDSWSILGDVTKDDGQKARAAQSVTGIDLSTYNDRAGHAVPWFRPEHVDVPSEWAAAKLSRLKANQNFVQYGSLAIDANGTRAIISDIYAP